MPVCTLDAFAAAAPRGCGLLGLDVGTKTIGVAIADPAWQVASPLVTLTRGKWPTDVAALAKIIKEREIGGLVVGLPRNMDGSAGPRAQSVTQCAANLTLPPATTAFGADLPVLLWDERLSTAAVERFLLADDMTRRRRDEVIDKAAAAYILQGALDRLRSL